ncbi:hypothetical protein PG994_013620 [Apiospora phragmitis]|uniref:Nitroreductase domain-containing protein n=1 Tax=Apiospora phragmitis TaxID=2905665 RepID=A0ABR1T963_9PEZI
MAPPGIVTTDQFLQTAKYRRSVYALKSTSPVSDERIEQVVQEILSFAPSSYNTQPVRITLVLCDKHAELFDEIIAAAQPFLTQVLLWERTTTLAESGQAHPSAAHMFGQWSDHAHGMAHLLTWSALALEGLAGSLQHHNAMPPVEAAMKRYAGVPDEYSLKANLVFGEEAQAHPVGPPPKLAFGETLKVLK